MTSQIRAFLNDFCDLIDREDRATETEMLVAVQALVMLVCADLSECERDAICRRSAALAVRMNALAAENEETVH